MKFMWLKIFLKMISDPVRGFIKLKIQYKKNEFYSYPALLLVLLYSIIMIPLSITQIPKMKELIPQTLEKKLSSSDIGQAEYEQLVSITTKAVGFNAGGIPINLILSFLVITLFLFVYLFFFSYELKFQQIFTVVSLSYFPNVIGYVLGSSFHLLNGFSFINSMHDFQRIIPGIHLFLNPDSNALLYSFLYHCNPFAIWNLVVLTIGLCILCKKDFVRTLVIIAIPWLIVNAVMALITMRSI